MGFFTAIGRGFAHYFDFRGRAQRSEYWFWTLFIGLVTISGLIAAANTIQPKSASTVSGLIGLGLALFLLVTMIPSLAVTVRRLHDTGRSGWWYLLAFLPFGAPVVMVFTMLEGQRGDNRFGPDPKQQGQAHDGRPAAQPDWVAQADARAAEAVRSAPSPAPAARSTHRPPRPAAVPPGGFGHRATFGQRRTPPAPARA